MLSLHKVSVKTKIILLALLPLTAFILSNVASIFSLTTIEQGAERIYVERVVPLKQLKMVSDDYAISIVDSLNKVNTGLIEPSVALAEINAARARVNTTWQSYVSTDLSLEERRLADEATQLFRQADQQITQVEDALKKLTGNTSGTLTSLNNLVYAIVDPITAKLNELVELQLTVAKEESIYITDLANKEETAFLIIGSVVALAVSLLGWIAYSSIVPPLNKLRHTILSVDSTSNLTLKVNLKTEDEIGETGKAFDNMMATIRNLVLEISDAS
jgi:methyl-accepting chemotaxis protein